MKILMINGSPHPKGCTFTALSEIGAELVKGGAEYEIVQIGGRAVRGCTACNRCKDGSMLCIYKDDPVNEIIEKLAAADGVIVGSPVYYASANGSLISLLDRIFHAAAARFEFKPAAAIVSARRGGTTATFDQLNKYFTINNMPVVSSQYWNMVHGNTPEEVMRDEEGLQIMRTLARNMIWLLKCIEEGKRAGIHPSKPEERIKTSFIR